ncbi:cytochrome P450 302a1, mitochondrial-like [Crassostrea virginica]|uniref:Cytochrome P450 27C1-like n=1 Tax=Crassostrea virginica TaxID=6565 RepID=A0A8B8EDL3_CRAVI|nr:cytochrome P450 27C1-like [Crassostrea virginica]XP_022338737.1 cytochrome P450 27C1-like [Crassostrea virginica]XP_022338744.1 cytochrome P450 27C1-like [Crassostrea virginica]XP_022338752.1 cytochrome P450 27C1-like [Crassostrea virginica]XP_022338761.1 cytochrome P450 27C1-like [Crassostrea virginica]
MMASNTFTSRLLRLKHARQLKLSRGSMTAADNALSLECLLERAAPPSQAALQPKPYRQVPGPRAYPVIGGIHHYMPGGRFHKRQFMDMHKECAEQYGPIYRETILPGLEFVHISDPKDIEEVFRSDSKHPVRQAFFMLAHYNKKFNENVQGLLTSHGEDWQTVRKNVQQKMLKPKAVAAYLPEHSIVADELWNHVMSLRDQEKEVDDLRPILDKYATECVGVVCFSKRLGAFSDPSRDSDAQRFIEAVSIIMEISQKEFKELPWYRVFRTPSFKKLIEAQSFIREIAVKYSREALGRISQGAAIDGEHGDLIPYLLSKTGLSERQVLTVICEFIFAGVDTTSHHLSFVLYLLGRHPEIQEKLYQEITDVLGDCQQVTESHIGKMSYLKAVTRETHRLHPVAPGNIRTSTKEIVLSGYKIPAGVQIAMHHDFICLQDDHFEKAQEFRPERWLRSNKARDETHPFASVPFGFGPRACIGRRFAEQESHIALIKLLTKYRLEYSGQELEKECSITYTPANKMTFRFHER